VKVLEGGDERKCKRTRCVADWQARRGASTRPSDSSASPTKSGRARPPTYLLCIASPHRK
jgi:hypothetical protein